MDHTESQTELILKHLRSGQTLTSLEALKLFNCFRCASRISAIRKGLLRPNELLHSEFIQTPHSKKHVAQYRIEIIKKQAA